MNAATALAAQLALAALLTVPALSAFAQSEPAGLNRVEVHGQRPADTPHFNVRESCPGIDVALRGPLDLAAYHQGQTGLVRVEFMVENGKAVDVRALGGPIVYRDDIHHAMRHVSCSSGSSAGVPQRYAMLIQFVGPDDDMAMASSGQRVALLELKQ